MGIRSSHMFRQNSVNGAFIQVVVRPIFVNLVLQLRRIEAKKYGLHFFQHFLGRKVIKHLKKMLLSRIEKGCFHNFFVSSQIMICFAICKYRAFSSIRKHNSCLSATDTADKGRPFPGSPHRIFHGTESEGLAVKYLNFPRRAHNIIDLPGA